MKSKGLTVFDVTIATLSIDGAGRKAGVTGVGKLCGVTPARAKRKLKEALSIGMVYAYAVVCGSQSGRICYSITETGRIMLDVLEEHKKMMKWALDYADAS